MMSNPMFRFTIRDVLWLTALVAVTLGLGIGWLRDRYELCREMNELIQNHHTAMENQERDINAAWEQTWEQWLTEKIESAKNAKGEPDENPSPLPIR